MVLLVLNFTFGSKGVKTRIQNYVRENQVQLETFAEDFMKTAYTGQETSYNSFQVNYWENANMVEFTVCSWGIAPSGSYGGFYYSLEDKPIGFQGTDLSFIKNDDQWIYEEENSDNRGVIEKIVDHWYWFEMSF